MHVLVLDDLKCTDDTDAGADIHGKFTAELGELVGRDAVAATEVDTAENRG